MKRIVIVGGGITGLSAAYHARRKLEEQGWPVELTLVEAADRLGGKIHTLREDAFLMEAGADSIVARKANLAPLFERLGLADEVVYNATGLSYLYADNRLKQIPEDAIFGIPLSMAAIVESELVSAEGKVRALKDFYTPLDETFTAQDSVGRLLRRCLGDEMVDKQIAPVLSGVYSGSIDELMIESTLPYLLDYKAQYGSILRGFFENREKFRGAKGGKFLSFRSGLSALVDGLERAIGGTEVLKGVGVERIVRENGRYAVELTGGGRREADGIVLSVPQPEARRMLNDSALDEEFGQFMHGSLVSVYLGFDVPDSALPGDGTGFITAGGSDVRCDACTWTSRKWAHTSRDGRLLIRLFYKSANPAFAGMQQMSAAEWAAAASADVSKALGLKARPVRQAVTMWRDAMPNYRLGHAELVRSLESKLAERYPGIYLAGCSYYGVGIPDCLANGERMADQVMAHLGSQIAPSGV